MFIVGLEAASAAIIGFIQIYFAEVSENVNKTSFPPTVLFNQFVSCFFDFW